MMSMLKKKYYIAGKTIGIIYKFFKDEYIEYLRKKTYRNQTTVCDMFAEILFQYVFDKYSRFADDISKIKEEAKK